MFAPLALALLPAMQASFQAVSEPTSRVAITLSEPLIAPTAGAAPDRADGLAYLWRDFDADGSDDVYVRIPAREDRLLLNRGASFEDVTARFGLAGLQATLAVTWVDLEPDGLPDLHVVESDGHSRLFHNAGTAFIEITGTAGLSHEGPALFHEWIDEDRDHRLDLHVVTPTSDVLFQNQGSGRFAAILLPTGGAGSGAIALPTSGPGEKGIPHPKSAASPESASRSTDGELRLGGRPAAGARSSPASTGTQNVGVCGSANVDDQGAAGCLQASSTPTLGMLYPLSTDLNVDGTGRVGVGTTTPTQKLDVDGTIRSRSGGVEFPDGSTQATAQVVDSGFAYGPGADPSATLQFLAPPATVTIASGQSIFATASKALGTRQPNGAIGLSLWLGYRSVPSGSIVVVGGGMIGNKAIRNTRHPYNVNGVITGLSAGTYEVGMVGGTTNVNWDSNGAGYTSALVFN